MMDSFRSFCESGVINQWVVNVRGEYAQEAAEFLREHVSSSLLITFHETRNGWLEDTSNLINNVSNHYIFYWIEDHVCIGGSDVFDHCIHQMMESQVDCLLYSWWRGENELSVIRSLGGVKCGCLTIVEWDISRHKDRKLNYYKMIQSVPFYVSLCSVMSKGFFERILRKSDRVFPMWGKDTPFNFEKCGDAKKILPFRFAYPNCELFASIDDDNPYPGYSLISRQRYRNDVTREQMLKIREGGPSLGKIIPKKVKRFWPVKMLAHAFRRIKNF